MSQMTIEVPTPRGTMPVHLHRPGDDGTAPLVVMYMDSLGVRPALHAHAERLATAGYAVALPDLFYFVDPADLPNVDRLRAGDPDEFGRMGALVARMEDEAVIGDTALMLSALHREHDHWGCVGFCMGGRYGLLAAERFADGVIAAALLHPSRLVTDDADSPHLAVGEIHGSLYLGFGERDHVTPPSTIPPLREQLEVHGVEHRIEVIPQADHGFTMPGMPSYHEAAAERAWAGTLAVLNTASA
jgi:carboxymethylenebutenolidase